MSAENRNTLRQWRRAFPNLEDADLKLEQATAALTRLVEAVELIRAAGGGVALDRDQLSGLVNTEKVSRKGTQGRRHRTVRRSHK